MAEDKENKEGSNRLLCASCRYALTGLDPDSVCPECGFSIPWSRELAAERLRPGDEVPRIRLAMSLLLLSTIIGIPAIVVYALLSATLGLNDPSTLPSWLLRGFQAVLLLGSALPLLTLASLPRRLHIDGGIGLMACWGVACLVGTALINSQNDLAFILGSALAVVSGIINLTRANRSIGSVVPAWARLGPARQTRTPLITAVILIALGRIVMSRLGGGPQLGPLETWVKFMVVGTEALLLVGSIYLFINRLWLSLRLWRAMMLRTKHQ